MVNATSNNTTEEKILQAARKIFVMKGMTGSRMQDIADEAGINKALLHYYFRNKEKLFEVVFWEAANELFLKMNGVFESNLGLLDKIRLFSMEYIEMVLKAPFIPQFLFTEINRNPDDFFSKLEKLSNKPNPRCFLGQFQEIF